MKACLALLLLCLPAVFGASDQFSAKVKNLKCKFNMQYKGTKVDTKKSKITCSKSKKTVKYSGSVTSSSSGNVFKLSLVVTKGKARITKASVKLAPKPTEPPTTEATTTEEATEVTTE